MTRKYYNYNLPTRMAIKPAYLLSFVSQRRRSYRKSRKVMERLCRKSSLGKSRRLDYPVVRKMFRVERPWFVPGQAKLALGEKPSLLGAGAIRHWARESLSQRFVQAGNLVDPRQDSVAGLSFPCGVNRSLVTGNTSSLTLLVRDPRVRKKFVKICRGVLGDLGISLVGPLPYRALEIMWEHFGEEHFSLHSRACWCSLCRSVGPARFSFLTSLGVSLYNFFVSWKSIEGAIFRVIVPAPLRTARFVANKLWKWLKIIFG